MGLTYTEVEQQKNTRIILFFAVVLLFYFLIALILANATKFFYLTQLDSPSNTSLFLSVEGAIRVLFFAFIAAVLHCAFSVSNALSFIQTNLNSQKIDLSDTYHQRFHTIVDEVNVATGSKYKITPVVIPTMAMNAFAISDIRKNAIVGATEGLLAKLNRQQLQAVVAHEVAHVASGDSLQTTIACSLFGIYAAILNGIQRSFRQGRLRSSGRGGGAVMLFLLFTYLLLSAMQFFYNLIRFSLSRQRELRADAVAVRLTRDPISLSEALFAISRGWRGLGYIDPNLEALFIMNPVKAEADEQEGLRADLFSTHPPIKKRIAILAEMAHSQVQNIQESVLTQEKLRENLVEMPVEKKQQQWMLMDEQGAWGGPHTISQIMLLGWLKPGTWVKPLDSQELKQAKDEPLFAPLFSRQMQGLNISDFHCPRCSQALVEEKYEGVALQRCFFCSGALVDKNRLPRIILRKEKGFTERIKKLAKITQENGLERMRRDVRVEEASLLKCPKCNASMLRSPYTLAYLVEVDACLSCNLVWFDQDELEVLQYLIENKETAKIKERRLE